MRLLISLLCACAMANSFMNLTTSSQPAAADYDVIIRNGRVIDGSGRPGFNADVAIKGDRITYVGNLRRAKATREIDARGQVVAPGFIDMLGQS